MNEIGHYTRVTDVLFPLSGLRQIDPEVLRKAADRGTHIHNVCSALIDDIKDPFILPEHVGYIESFKKWYGGKSFGPQSQRLFCDKYGITGEFDCLYHDGDGYVLVDFKTPANESKTWMLQGSAYSYLAKKEGYNINRIEFVKLDKNGKIPRVYEYKEDFSLFVKCLEVYRYFFKDRTEENPMDYL